MKEWLLLASGAGMLLSSVFLNRGPAYSTEEFEVIFILLTLFIAVNGLQRSGLISDISRRIEKGRAVPLKLVLSTFFLSMLITNDAALIVVVPLTLALNIRRKDILVIMEALAANAGSALTPFGNPQNLYIYWSYDLNLLSFLRVIAPFSLFFLVLLTAASLLIRTERTESRPAFSGEISKSAPVYGLLLAVVLLSVLHILPVYAAAVVFVYPLLADRKVLRVDYSLLISFFFFFGIADNLQTIFEGALGNPGHVFLFSSLLSQIISNVPAALLFADFTDNWQALLWGVNAGGFGSLFGSLANLIAYKIYVSDVNTDNYSDFTRKFLLIGYTAFLLSVLLYSLLFTLI